MGRASKLDQYQQFNRQLNCYGRHQEHGRLLSNWRRKSQPLFLEIGAGTARVALTFSQLQPNWQVLALDRKSNRLQKMAGLAQAYPNLVFLQADVRDLDFYLDLKAQVDLIWLAFPDPYPKIRQSKHRLTHPQQLAFYQAWLRPKAKLRFKTDQPDFFVYTRSNFKPPLWLIKDQSSDLLAAGYHNYPQDVQIKTSYEEAFLANQAKIHYLEVEFQGN